MNNEPRTRIVECLACEGEGRIEHSGYYGFDRETGTPLVHYSACECCNGTGGVEVELEPITLEDLEERDRP